MSRFDFVSALKKEVPASSMFPITHLNSPSVFETRTGMIGSVIAVQGVPFVTELNETLNQHVAQLHQTLLNVVESWMLYVTLHRQKKDIVLKGEFSSSLAREIDERYHARFRGQNVFHNTFYLTLILKGNTSTKTNRFMNWANEALGKKLKEVHALAREEKMKKLHRMTQQLLTNLSTFKPRLLGAEDSTHSELITFLSLVANGGKPLFLKFSQQIPPVAKNIAQTFNDDNLYPNGLLGQHVCNHRIFFGNQIQFEGLNDRRFGVMLSVKKYPRATGSLILDPLLEVDCELIATQSFAPIARDVALESIRIKRDKLVSSNDKGESQIDALQQLEDDIASEQARLGFHHNTVMVLNDSVASLESSLYEVEKAYSYSGMTLVRETLGSEPAFWAQIPGNQHLISRASLISSKNFTDFCSLHNMQTGYCNANHLGSAVTILETPSKTPVYFNFHTKSSKTNPAKGHTAIFGSNDAGKTTLAALLDAQMNRYNGRTFFIDRNEGLKIYILASGNSAYTVISPKYRNKLAMNPLQLPDTAENRTFLKTWLKQLILQNNETDLPSEIAEVVSECIDYSFEQLDKPYRTLSQVSRYFPTDFPRWPELRRWLKAHGSFNEGEYSWLFDNDHDALSFDFDKAGFDVTYLMDEVTSAISTPVYAYLVHRMRQCLDGRLTTFVLDEFQQILRSPFWVEYLNAWLPTIRKRNGHFVFMTQSPENVVASPVCATVLNNVATKIYFPNPQADESLYLNILKLTRAEYQIIQSNMPDSRCFLYKQGSESIWCKLDLSSMGDILRVLSGNTKSALLLDEIINETGNNPDVWLPIFLKRSAHGSR